MKKCSSSFYCAANGILVKPPAQDISPGRKNDKPRSAQARKTVIAPEEKRDGNRQSTLQNKYALHSSGITCGRYNII